MRVSVITSILLYICVFSVHVAGAIPDPTQQLRPFINQVIAVLDDQDQQGDKVERIMEVARQGFDFHEMSKRVLGRHWRSLSQAQQEEFVVLFTELLKYAYVSQMEKYSHQEVEFGKQRVKGKRAQVQTTVVDGARTIPVSYIMKLDHERWKVYDIVVEGVSLVRNYLEQFQEILRKEEFSGLTRQIQMKIDEFAAKSDVG